jgi:succinate dehydrogenase / fumarate reductase, membrane anchor subunit
MCVIGCVRVIVLVWGTVMVKLNLLGSGVFDWLVQRLTAVIILGYCIALIGFWLQHPSAQLTFMAWQHYLQHPFMRLFGSLAWIALIWHAWLGVWTIATDYIKHEGMRQVILGLVVMALIAYLSMAIMVSWSLF